MAAPALNFTVAKLPSPLGPLLVVSDSQHCLRGLGWEDREDRLRRDLARIYGREPELARSAAPAAIRRALHSYFAGKLQAIDEISVQTGGTPFQSGVWCALRKIPAGTTLSYGRMAHRLKCPLAVRAVGFANGSNPISVVIPCHRLIGADGSLTGYGGGLERKRWLLEHEGVEVSG
ncbi:MAG TPA: methylated-DNA--[protein]-cysteine S-methyltransferase [Steroidobacteraceae bacterium]|jgi:methylated-DNA-[protein]-cysteine S-methyltransferase